MTDDMSNDTNELFATIAELRLELAIDMRTDPSFLLSLQASSFPSPKCSFFFGKREVLALFFAR